MWNEFTKIILMKLFFFVSFLLILGSVLWIAIAALK